MTRVSAQYNMTDLEWTTHWSSRKKIFSIFVGNQDLCWHFPDTLTRCGTDGCVLVQPCHLLFTIQHSSKLELQALALLEHAPQFEINLLSARKRQ